MARDRRLIALESIVVSIAYTGQGQREDSIVVDEPTWLGWVQLLGTELLRPPSTDGYDTSSISGTPAMCNWS